MSLEEQRQFIFNAWVDFADRNAIPIHYVNKWPLPDVYPRPIKGDEVQKSSIQQCRKCSHKVPMTVNLVGKYCPKCGHKHPTHWELVEETKRPRCPYCHAANQNGLYCMACGRKIRKE